MKLIDTYFDSVKLIEPTTHPDERGTFTEYLNPKLLDLIAPDELDVVLEYISTSKLNVLRGLHYQINSTQGKLVTVLQGSVFDVVVDLRRGSVTFGQHISLKLSAETRHLLWIPAGFAHGFMSLSDHTMMSYKCTGPYSPQNERCIKYDDASLAIEWPKKGQLIVSSKDLAGMAFEDAPYLN